MQKWGRLSFTCSQIKLAWFCIFVTLYPTLAIVLRPMITFYARPTCPYCIKVRELLDTLDVEYVERDISEEEYLVELMDEGGKEQVPFIVDEDNSVSMYESDDIADYLEETYGNKDEE
jgi:glutaredoxin